MSNAKKVPNAWDDDWVENADSAPAVPEPASTGKKLSKAERRAKQAEFNRQLWDSASYYIHTQNDVPLKSEFKPAMKVLSRKPPMKPVSNGIESGVGQLNLEEDDDDDEADVKKPPMTLEQRQAKALKDREEKQRKYDEARQRLFGNDTSKGPKNAGIVTSSKNRENDFRHQSRNKGGASEHRPSSSAGKKIPELYDPNNTVKAESKLTQRKDGQCDSGRSTPVEQVPIRSPKGPDGSGRGGHGFAPRGDRTT